MKFFRVKDYIGVSIKAILLTAAIIVGISGPVAAMDTTKMLTMFFGGGSSGSAPSGATFIVDGADYIVDGSDFIIDGV